MIIVGPFGLLCLVLLCFKPVRRIAGYFLLVIFIIGIGAFGHVEFINRAPWVALLIAAVPFLPLARRRRG